MADTHIPVPVVIVVDGRVISSVYCCLCHRSVTMTDVSTGLAYPSRIGGDSVNGYELVHVSCVNA